MSWTVTWKQVHTQHFSRGVVYLYRNHRLFAVRAFFIRIAFSETESLSTRRQTGGGSVDQGDSETSQINTQPPLLLRRLMIHDIHVCFWWGRRFTTPQVRRMSEKCWGFPHRKLQNSFPLASEHPPGKQSPQTEQRERRDSLPSLHANQRPQTPICYYICHHWADVIICRAVTQREPARPSRRTAANWTPPFCCRAGDVSAMVPSPRHFQTPVATRQHLAVFSTYLRL